MMNNNTHIVPLGQDDLGNVVDAISQIPLEHGVSYFNNRNHDWLL